MSFIVNIMEKKHTDLITVIQSDFPITDRPFQTLGDQIGWTEREVIDSLRSLMDDCLVRTFGPVFVPGKLGYVSTLMALKVEHDRVAELAAVILDIPEITHNYLRDHKLNMWFTITSRTRENMEDIINRVEKFPGVKMILNLAVLKTYKINAVFGVERKNSFPAPNHNDHIQPLNDKDQKIVKTLQSDFPIVDRPFRIIDDISGTSELHVIETINRWLYEGTIRRFGARLNHRKVGYKTNILAAWRGQHIDKWGEKFAELAEVSHCYKRQSCDDWPYELYTMIHTKTDMEMDNIFKAKRNIAPDAEFVTLKTLYELKKTSMKYFMEN